MLKMFYSLVGIDGNVFNIIAYTVEAMRRTKYSKKEREEFQNKLFSQHDYYTVVAMCADKIDEINKERIK